MMWDKMWDESFLNQIAATTARNPHSNPVDWRVGGKVSTAKPNKEDKAWWDENGKKMFFDFINAWQESHFELWVSEDNVPGVEIEFNQMFGTVPIKAFADAMVVTPAGELAVVDFKTGSYMPDSSMQLGVYACCMEMQYGVRPTKGYFYSARKGLFLEASGLDRWTIPVMTEMFEQFARGLEAEVHLPNLNMMCGSCGVKDYCYAYGGQLAPIYDPLANLTK
jgi:RecB family exonuclease